MQRVRIVRARAPFYDLRTECQSEMLDVCGRLPPALPLIRRQWFVGVDIIGRDIRPTGRRFLRVAFDG